MSQPPAAMTPDEVQAYREGVDALIAACLALTIPRAPQR